MLFTRTETEMMGDDHWLGVQEGAALNLNVQVPENPMTVYFEDQFCRLEYSEASRIYSFYVETVLGTVVGYGGQHDPLNVKIQLTEQWTDAVEHFAPLLLFPHVAEVSLQLLITDVGLHRLFPGVFMHDWYSVSVSFRNGVPYRVFVYFSEFEHETFRANAEPDHKGDHDFSGTCGITWKSLDELRENLLQRYIESRRTVASFAVSYVDRSLPDYYAAAAALDELVKRCMKEFDKQKIKGWIFNFTGGNTTLGYFTQRNHAEEKMVLIVNGYERTRCKTHDIVTRLVSENPRRVWEEVESVPNEFLVSVDSRSCIRETYHLAPFTWHSLHASVLDLCIAFEPLRLPVYAFLEIIDWLPLVWPIEHVLKVRLLIGVRASFDRIAKRRST